MKILVFGVNGMAGHMISLYLKEQGHDVTGFAKQKCLLCDSIVGNACDRELVKKTIGNGKYDRIINCIGILNKAVDSNLTDGIYLNSVFPHFLVDCLEGTDTKLIHISSDCVFLGERGNYTEKSVPDADSYYGKTKALGEIVDNKNLTLRTSIVGPELKNNGIGLFHWFMNQTGVVNGFTEVIWSGVTTLELAKSINVILKQDITGLYHLVNNQTISKHDLLCLFNKYINHDRTDVKENGSFFNNKSLIDTRNEFIHKIPSYEDMIIELSEWMDVHKELYYQYYSK